MKSLVAIVLTCIFITYAKGQPSSAGVFVVPVGGGQFEFSELSVVVKILPELHGFVSNKTDKDWALVTFEVYLLNDKGKQVYGSTGSRLEFSLGRIKKGEVKSLAIDGHGKTLLIDRNAKVARIGIKFIEGVLLTDYKISLVKPVSSKGMGFEDEVIKIDWVFTNQSLGFVLANKTEAPIKLDWNQVSYVDVAGQAAKVIHDGVKYINRNEAQPPTIIPPTAKVTDLILPVNNVYYSELTRSWLETPMFPVGNEALLYKGKTFSLFMPLEVNGSTKNYTFTFKVSDVILGGDSVTPSVSQPTTNQATSSATAKTCYEGGRKAPCP